MNQRGDYIRGTVQAPAPVLGGVCHGLIGEPQIKRQADVRPASPVESELSRLDSELARLDGLCRSLADRLKPVTICEEERPGSCGNPPYNGCQIGERINGSSTRVRDIADNLDSLLSVLQI